MICTQVPPLNAWRRPVLNYGIWPVHRPARPSASWPRTCLGQENGSRPDRKPASCYMRARSEFHARQASFEPYRRSVNSSRVSSGAHTARLKCGEFSWRWDSATGGPPDEPSSARKRRSASGSSSITRQLASAHGDRRDQRSPLLLRALPTGPSRAHKSSSSCTRSGVRSAPAARNLG